MGEAVWREKEILALDYHQTSASLIHANLIPDSVITNTTGADTGSLSFYASYGKSDPVVKFTVDVDAAYFLIAKEIAKLVAEAVTSGASATVNPIIDLLPSPYDIEFGIAEALKMANLR